MRSGSTSAGCRAPHARECEQLGAEGHEVVGRAGAFQVRVEAMHEPAAVGGDAGRAATRVAAERLDAADGQHRLAADVDHVASERQRVERGVGEPEPAGADEDDVLGEPRAREQRIDAGHAELEGERHVIAERQRRRSGSALAAVDREEVRTGAGRRHPIGELPPEAEVTDRRLDAHGQAGRVRESLDERDQPGHVGEGRVGRGARAVPVGGDTAHAGDLLRDLRCGQQPSETGLGALGQLDLDRPDGCLGDAREQPVEREVPGRVATAEVTGPDLEDQLAAVQMRGRETALTRVVQAAGESGAAIERLYGHRRQRAVAHPRDVHDRRGPEGARPAVCGAEHLARR